MTIRHWALIAAAAFILPHSAMAADGDDKSLKSILSKMPNEIAGCRTHDRTQEDADAKLLANAWELLKARNVTKLRAMLPELEAAGKRAPDVPAIPEKCDGKIFVYTDDIMTMLLAAGAAGKDKDENIEVIMMPPPPYARLHFIIGWLYFEQENFETADAWFARGLKNDPHDAMLASEHANALSNMGRSAEALTFVDAFLDANELSDPMQALMLRRRGFALGDLGRHEEAITAYKASLKLDPGNNVSKEEIKWNKEQLKAQKTKAS